MSLGARLDHITVVAPDLESGAAYVEAALGAVPGAGRTHPGMGTHNLLLSLGADVYLEVIAADPKAPPPTRSRWFGLDHVGPGSRARLSAWVASTDDIDEAAVPEVGVVETMHREQVSWKMAMRADGSVPLGGAGPLLIQRSGASPAAVMPPSGLVFERLRIRHPEPSRVIDLFERIGLASPPAIGVDHGSRCSLVAEVRTPFGLRELGTPAWDRT